MLCKMLQELHKSYALSVNCSFGYAYIFALGLFIGIYQRQIFRLAYHGILSLFKLVRGLVDVISVL